MVQSSFPVWATGPHPPAPSPVATGEGEAPQRRGEGLLANGKAETAGFEPCISGKTKHQKPSTALPNLALNSDYTGATMANDISLRGHVTVVLVMNMRRFVEPADQKRFETLRGAKTLL